MRRPIRMRSVEAAEAEAAATEAVTMQLEAREVRADNEASAETQQMGPAPRRRRQGEARVAASGRTRAP